MPSSIGASRWVACGFGIVQRRARCAVACIVAGGASDVHVRACGVCHAHSTLACGCVASCRPGMIA